jgi:methyltransferase (TIGR00027 family)
MLPGRSSRTAELVAAVRAVETGLSSDQRLFSDDLAAEFLRPNVRRFVRLCGMPWIGAAARACAERVMGGGAGWVLCRTHYIDQRLMSALRGGTRQVVILGAGFDSRAYRLPGVERQRFFEVDHPATQAFKQRVLQRALGRPRPHVVFVPVDFERDSLAERLVAAGYAASEPTLFIWEGVTSYLSDPAIDQTLAFIGEQSALGSALVMTYLDQRLTPAQTAQPVSRAALFARRAGEPYTAGLDPRRLAERLARFRLHLLEDVSGAEVGSQLFAARRRRSAVSPLYRIAWAQVAPAIQQGNLS